MSIELLRAVDDLGRVAESELQAGFDLGPAELAQHLQPLILGELIQSRSVPGFRESGWGMTPRGQSWLTLQQAAKAG